MERFARRAPGWALVLSCAACSAPEASPPPPVAAPPECEQIACACPEGFASEEPGSCSPVVPAAGCPEGMRPVLGATECEPVGWASPCPEGMLPDPSGWGCAPVLPPDACQGAALARLGSQTCEPLRDCAAPFPPADAMLHVDDDFGPEELDATHFASVGAALAGAPAGAVVAIEAGTYVESLMPKRPIRLVGRCAEKTVIVTPGDGLPGVQVVGAKDVRVEGLTFRGHRGGAVLGGGSLTVRDCLFDAVEGVGLVALGGHLDVVRAVVRGTHDASGQFGFGALAQSGASLALKEVVLEGNRGFGVQVTGAGARAVIEASIVQGTRTMTGGPDHGLFGYGVRVRDGGECTISRSVVRKNRVANLQVYGAGSLAVVEESLLEGATADATGLLGSGVEVRAGGRVEVRKSALVANANQQLVVADAGSTASVSGSVARGLPPHAQGAAQAGLLALAGAALEVDGTAVVDAGDVGIEATGTDGRADVAESLVLRTRRVEAADRPTGQGVAVGHRAALTLARSAVLENEIAGLWIFGSGIGTGGRAVVTGTVIGRTRPGAARFGRGIELHSSGELDLEGSAVLDNDELGLQLGMPGSVARVRGSVLGATANPSPQYGHGIVAFDQATLELVGSFVQKNRSVGLLFSNASASLDASVVAHNGVGIHAQNGSTLRELDELPLAPGAGEVLVSSSTEWVENASRIGDGLVPLPDATPGETP